MESYIRSTSIVVSLTAIFIILEVILLRLNFTMEISTQTSFFTSILDKMMHAPINLYHDITPMGRIFGYFYEDMEALDSKMYLRCQELITKTTSIIFIFI